MSTKIVLEKMIHGRKIVLRAPQIDDAVHATNYWFGPASKHLLPFTNASALGSEAEFLARIQQVFGNVSSEGPWSSLIGEVDGITSGTVLINSLVPSEEALVHVHIWDPSLRRTGIANQLAFDVFKYFLDGFKLKRLILQVPAENLPAVRLLESLGLKSEGIFFGKAAPICKEGHYARFVVTREAVGLVSPK